MYSITFKDIRCEEAGLLVVKRPDIPVAERKVDLITIAGRDGALTSDISRYATISFSIAFNFMAKTPDGWNDMARLAKKWAQGSGNLVQSDDQGHFYKVLYTRVTACERTSKRIGVMAVDFICDPFIYVSDGQYAHSIAECEYNPYDICHPAYVITGYGTATLTVNGNAIQVMVTDQVTLDSDLMLAYDVNNEVVNTSTIGDFEGLYLQEGENTIEISDGFSMVIVPRWRHI